MTYVYSQRIEPNRKGCCLSIEIFKESETEYRPIVTACTDHTMGFSVRRSYPSELMAFSFYNDNKDMLIDEAVADYEKLMENYKDY